MDTLNTSLLFKRKIRAAERSALEMKSGLEDVEAGYPGSKQAKFDARTKRAGVNKGMVLEDFMKSTLKSCV